MKTKSDIEELLKNKILELEEFTALHNMIGDDQYQSECLSDAMQIIGACDALKWVLENEE